MRQLYLTQCLVILIDDILEEGSRTRDNKEMPNKSDKAASELEALAKLTIQDRPPAEHSLADLIASVEEQKAALDEYFSLLCLCTEPVVLAHAVNIWFFSQPDLVPDEKGIRLPAHTDRYISGAVLEAVHSAVRGAAVWDYICRLLALLKNQAAEDTIYRAIVLQRDSQRLRSGIRPRLGPLQAPRPDGYGRQLLQAAAWCARQGWKCRCFHP